MGEEPTDVRLRVHGETVAEYVLDDPEVDPRWSPRPYLHPVRTLGGTPVTDAMPADHRWHLGVSVAMQDVSGTNLWGGRTYVRDAGYTWLDDHGRILHDGWLPAGAAPDGGSALAQRLRWLDLAGATLLVEERRVAAAALAGQPGAWLLDFGYTLTAPADREVVLGSPATNGRPGGAGYGGFFWRVAPGQARTFTATADGEDQVNGSTEPWLALVGRGDGGASYTLVFTGLADGDHWFVRTGIYPGVCVALAFERTLPVPAGTALRRRHRIVVADGELTRDEVLGLAPVAVS
ncbi:PmoA family protein [Plantactinospora sp. S1510]|uniref:PmoA family protein n=1 Tax=Plantactinospora alkalitolerans TaxID=2789879 RepID=A0ABS0H0Y0_9ACTN|nr:PmoA family protein [Plantactinospora alkalitolerans]MBF9132100.1 PmoA family protein [Plantactinospora alkalitolerans]